MKYFLLLVVTWCVSCVGPYRQVDEVGGVGYDVLEDDSENYIIGYKGNAFTNRYLAYDLLKLKSADLALEKNMPF